LFGAEFTRESTRVQQQKSLDDALNRLERDIQRDGVSRAQNITAPEDAAALKEQAEAQRVVVARLRQVRATGRIVLAPGEEGVVSDLPDLQLEDGDRLYVPAPPSIVQVIGSVFNAGAMVYRPGKRMTDYLAQAGGPTRDADQGSIYVLRADGSVISARQSGVFSGFLLNGLEGKRLMPGDSVVVPEMLDKTTFMRTLKDVSQIFYQFGLGAAALKVLKD
jgi:protein involved in polysaccharide export with SLBB domain